MGKKWFTADWHAGEGAERSREALFRYKHTNQLVDDWLQNCHDSIQSPEDTLYMLGDMILTVDDVSVLAQLPDCRKILIKGDKERRYNNIYLSGEVMEAGVEFVADVLWETMGGNDYCMLHRPDEAFERSEDMPFLCGHVHKAWTFARLPNGQPIINVGIDAWGRIVSEDEVVRLTHLIRNGQYDKNCYPADW